MIVRATRGLASALVVVLAASVSRDVVAATPEERAMADQLFKDGRALVKAGAYAEACPKLATSDQLDPTPGTKLALGDCYELAGKTASAWTTFTDAAASAQRAGDTKRLEEATRRRDLIQPKLSMLVVDVPPEERLPGLEVKRNGTPITAAMIGVALPVDPGLQTVEVTLPGKQPWSGQVTIAPSPGTTRFTVPILLDAAPGAVVGPAPVKPSSTGNGQRIAGVVVGSVGLAGLVVGAVFGGLAISTVGDIEDRKLCDDGEPVQCSQEGLDLQGEANTQANVANVALAVGGAAVVTGVIVFFTAPRVKRPPPNAPVAASVDVSPVVGPDGAALVVRGAF